ncbi:MAG: DUF805 domain-containing protein [Pseudomonadota bacterium]
MTLLDGWAYAFGKFGRLDGRARRTEYFSLYLLQVFWYFAVLLTRPLAFSEVAVALILLASGLVFVVPSISVTVRRLHDAGLSGWFTILFFVPFGAFVLFLMALIPPQPAGDRYGPDPREDGAEWS